MLKSVTLRRTMTLVLCALFATALLTSFAFVLAGKTTTVNVDVDEAFSQANTIAQMLTDSPELISDDSFRNSLFNSSTLTGRYFFLIDEEGNTVYGPSDDGTKDSKYFSQALSFAASSLSPDGTADYSVIDADNIFDKVLVISMTVPTADETYHLVSVSSVTDTNSIIGAFVNILLISTLASALLMMIPVYLVVKRIVGPIQKINDTARAYGQGDFTVRANEDEKGECGELASSFNYLADQLSRSIQNLTVERNQLQDIFDTISEGIVSVDNQLKPVMVNKTMETIFDKVPAHNYFTSKLQLIPFDEVWDKFDECIKSKEKAEFNIEGASYAYKVIILPKLDVDSINVVGATAFFRDIYDEEKLERTRKDYVANISHELRTPLQTLRGLVEPLADGMVKKEEDKMRYYGIILHETMRLSRLIDDMLELSKLQSRTLAFKTFPFDLNELMSELETKFIPVMKDAGINFKVVFSNGSLPTVMGNPDRVEQIIIILLDNAKKYTPEGGSITIEAGFIEQEDHVNISVIDTGQGIHEYDINHIFDRFFKADRARGKKGTGLGLAIAKELLSYMGEKIEVRSTYGEGTTFTFTLKKVSNNSSWF